MRKVPVIMQMEAVECGAASLSMVLASYGRWVSLEEMRIVCGVSRDGVTAGDLVKAGKTFGLEMEGYRMEPSDLRDLKEPSILFMDLMHFVVLVGFIGPIAIVNDPARGRTFLSPFEMSRSFSGLVLTCHPTAEFKKGGSPTTTANYITSHLKGARQAMLITLVTSLLLAIVSIALPIASQAFADGIMTGKNPEWGTPLVYTLTGMTIFQLIVNLIAAFYGNKLDGRLQVSATSNFIWHLLRLPMRFFAMRMPGDLIRRVTQAGTIPNILVQQIAPMAVNLMMLTIYGIFMYQYSAMLSILVVCATIFVIVTVFGIGFIQMNIARRSERDAGKLQTITMSTIENIETIKAAGAEEGSFKRWASAFARSTNSQILSNQITEYVSVVPQLSMQLATNLVLIIGCSLILQGNLTIGMLMAFQGFMGSFVTPMTSVVTAVTALITMRSQMERVEDIYRSVPDVEAASADKRDPGVGKLSGELELRHITFGYSTMREPLIKDFSCHLQSGQSIAFVGASGCGKSTLANLISGLYQPWEGEVLYDGKPMSEINRGTFASSVAVINQTTAFFDGTLSENIKLWDDSIEDFAMILACRDAQIHEEISCRIGDYQSHIEAGGRNFSGGQCQRLEIASALTKEPVILIMDEATSALDAETEAKVMKAVKDLGITLIIIAHRLSTIRDCDEIVVLDHGNVLERGNHEQLLAQQGHYYQLIKDM